MNRAQYNKYYTTEYNFNAGKQIDESGNLALLQTTDYYPFGLTMANGNKANADQPYQYGGKEWQNNTQVYDFHARQYNPALGRWFNPDPLMEKYAGVSSYNYCLNNPINMIDPDGREVTTENGITTITGSADINSVFNYLVSEINNHEPLEEDSILEDGGEHKEKTRTGTYNEDI